MALLNYFKRLQSYSGLNFYPVPEHFNLEKKLYLHNFCFQCKITLEFHMDKRGNM